MNRSAKPSLLALMFLISFASAGALLYTPAIPAIAAHFGVTIGQSQNTVTYFLLGYAFGQLPYGPLLNTLGRKPTIYLGCGIAIVGSVICILADVITLFWLLNLGRLIMGLGMAVGLVSTFTLIGDSLERKQAHRTTSYLSAAFPLMAGLAIVIGGFLTETVGWVYCFYFLIVYCVWIFFLATRLPKTGPEPFTHSLHPVLVAKGYWKQLATPSVLLGSLILGANSGISYVFSTKAPFIGIELIDLSADVYGLWRLVPSLGTVTGAILSAYLSARYAPRPLVWTGMIVVALSVATTLTFFAFGIINVWTLFIPTTLGFPGLTITYAAISSSITSEATDKSNASAVMTFLNMIVSAISVLIVGVVATKSALFLPLMQFILVLLTFLSIGIYVIIHRRPLHGGGTMPDSSTQ